VSIINGIATIVMTMIVYVVEAVMSLLGITQWENGRYLLENSLINYDQIASVPSLYHIVSPEWQPWMNDTIIGHIIKMFGVSLDLSWITTPFREFYESLAPEQGVIIGMIVLLIPIVYLGIVYYKNRHYVSG